ncbi:MAG: dTMP kinase [Actinomycetia bacterium]|nr:dTMP kinase [Actinomycetes bacterium]MCP4223163.1 dTMP kinase [Actinomycetes bacterium]
MAYIVFEGGEGSGKSTQAQVLAERLDAVLTREPGATELGAQLRKLLLEPGQAPVEARAETLLMAADRAQHMTQIVKPALDAGRHVVADRSLFSSLAYQGGGRGLGVDEVRRLNAWAIDGCWPDVVVLLDLSLDAARRRLDRGLDRLEQEDAAFHERVRSTYLELAAKADNWIVLDGDQSIDAVTEAVWSSIAPIVSGAPA